MVAYKKVKITPNVKRLARKSRSPAQEAAKTRAAALADVISKGEGPRTTKYDPGSMTGAQVKVVRGIRKQVGDLIRSSYDLVQLAEERCALIEQVLLYSYLKSKHVPVSDMYRYGPDGDESIDRGAAIKRALDMATLHSSRVDQDYLDELVASIDLLEVGRDADLIRDKLHAWALQDRLVELSHGTHEMRSGSKDLDDKVCAQIDQVSKVYQEVNRVDHPRYRKAMEKLEDLIAHLSLPDSPSRRLSGASKMLGLAESQLGGASERYIEEVLAKPGYSWHLDLKVCKSIRYGVSSLRVAWDMLFYMTNSANEDVAVYDLSAEDSFRWDVSKAETDKPPSDMVKSFWELAKKKGQEVHVYHYDGNPLVKLSPHQLQPNSSYLTETQRRMLIWNPWMGR